MKIMNVKDLTVTIRRTEDGFLANIHELNCNGDGTTPEKALADVYRVGQAILDFAEEDGISLNKVYHPANGRMCTLGSVVLAVQDWIPTMDELSKDIGPIHIAKGATLKITEHTVHGLVTTEEGLVPVEMTEIGMQPIVSHHYITGDASGFRDPGLFTTRQQAIDYVDRLRGRL